VTSPGGDDLLIRAAIRDELSGPLERIRRDLRQTGNAAEDAGKRANRGARGFDVMAGGVGRLATTAGKGALLAMGGLGLGIAAVGTAALTMGVSTASAMQQASISFTTMLGSGQKAQAFLGDLKKFAATTPFEFPELQTAASSLISAGIESSKVIPIMRTLGDVTSGMGTGAEGVQRATIALQQMSAAGRITGEDLAQLRDAGIPVYQLLAAATGKTTAEVTKLADAGKLGGKELGQLMTALETGKGLERFSGLMEKQSKSLAGVWSTLKDNVNMALSDAVQPAIPGLTHLVDKAGALAGKYLPLASAKLLELAGKGREVWNVLKAEGLEGAVGKLDSLAGMGGKLAHVFEVAAPIIGDVVEIVKSGLAPAAGDAGLGVGALLTQLGLMDNVLAFLADHTTLVHVATTGLVVALTAAKVATMGYAAWQTASNAYTVTAAAVRGLLTGATVAQTGAEELNTAAKAQNIAASIRSGAVATVTAVRTGIVTAATAGYTAAQWLLNAALTANPIGLVIAAVAGLAVGIVLLWKHSETFRTIVTAAFREVAQAGLFMADKLLWVYESIARAAGHLPGPLGKPFRAAADAIGTMRDKLKSVSSDLDSLGQKSVTVPVRAVFTTTAPGAQGAAAKAAVLGKLDAMGDTATSRARRPGNLDRTLASHARYSAQTGAKARVTNALVGNGGRGGRGSGDHPNGLALDLVGTGLDRYARAVREDGGYASWHGDGPSKHLHAVPAGDTSSSMARRPSAGGGGGSVVHQYEGDTITLSGLGMSPAEVEAMLERVLAKRDQEREERSYVRPKTGGAL
jgi:tape measure domain-containing protein